MSLPLIIIGAGGHGHVVADLARAAGFNVAGFLDTDAVRHHTQIDGCPVLGNDTYLNDIPPGTILLANGIGGASKPEIRRAVFARLAAAGYEFPALAHPNANVANGVILEAGCQIMAGATVQPGVRVEADAVVNTGAVVDHDCQLGAHCHVAPGAVLCGGVMVETAAHIGAAACVIQYVRIGAGALVAAGAVVVRDVPPQTKMAGVPARTME